ncbi:MAG: HAD-IIIA family hydrolase [Pelagibacterales bacterium]|nr:HAD-IIIA family hydrolase [Pelagibacterales bacterium]MBL6875100.1 HAD-IIIA family hydrolase [Flavobacteriales bacterium]
MFDTLFLDRDGVINKKLEGRYVTNFDEFVFVKNSDIAIRKLHKIFKRILIVTNQQGIGKGIMTEDDLNLLHMQMQRKLNVDFDLIDKIYFCPCLEGNSCNCRKPKTGMLENAKSDFPEIVIENSFLVGDSDSDIIAGESFGLKTIKVSTEFTLFDWLIKITE